jgi:hypothetical protein
VFAGPGQEAALAPITRDPEIPDDLDPILAETLIAMTARVPANRPTAHEVALALRGIRRLGDFRASDDPENDATAALLAGMPDTAAATKLMPAAEMSGTASTALLEPRTAGTLSANEETASVPSPAPAKRRRPRVVASVVAAVVAVIAAVIVAVVIAVSGSPDPTPVEYPEVPGTIGEHLSELQDSVTP